MAWYKSIRVFLILSLYLAVCKRHWMGKRRNVNCIPCCSWTKNLSGAITLSISKRPLEKEIEAKIEPTHLVQGPRAKCSWADARAHCPKLHVGSESPITLWERAQCVRWAEPWQINQTTAFSPISAGLHQLLTQLLQASVDKLSSASVEHSPRATLTSLLVSFSRDKRHYLFLIIKHE